MYEMGNPTDHLTYRQNGMSIDEIVQLDGLMRRNTVIAVVHRFM